jgi:LPS export ABC transporter protein LptC
VPRPLSFAESPQDAISLPDVEGQGLHLIAQTGSTVTWDILAERAAFSQAQRRTRVYRVEAQLTGDAADAWRITAARGLIEATTGDMIVEGQVRLQQGGGYTIDTNKLYWDTVNRLLHTDTPVTMHSTHVAITGKGLYSQVDQRLVTLEHDIHARFHLRRFQ